MDEERQQVKIYVIPLDNDTQSRGMFNTWTIVRFMCSAGVSRQSSHQCAPKAQLCLPVADSLKIICKYSRNHYI